MAIKRLKRPRDPLSLGKMVGDILTGQVSDAVDDGKSKAAAELGAKGGKARAENLSEAQRTAIAKRAARKRWGPK